MGGSAAAATTIKKEKQINAQIYRLYQTVTGQRIYRCDLCDENFGSDEKRKHIYSNHHRRRLFKFKNVNDDCAEPKIEDASVVDVKMEKDNSKPNDSPPEQLTRNPSTLITPTDVAAAAAAVNIDYSWHCDQCPKTFRCRGQWQDHIHFKSKAGQICSHCRRRFSSKQKLKQHVRSVHDASSNRNSRSVVSPSSFFKCVHCPQIFEIRRYLNLHIIGINSTSYPCNICHGNYSSKRSLKVHMERHQADH